MAKANISLPNGTKVVVDGSPDEITKVLAFYGAGEEAKRKPASRGKKKSPPKKKLKDGPNTRIQELISEDYFSEPRLLKDVLEKLKERGHIYASGNISNPIRRLVQQGSLRRIKENGKWVYVNP